MESILAYAFFSCPSARARARALRFAMFAFSAAFNLSSRDLAGSGGFFCGFLPVMTTLIPIAEKSVQTGLAPYADYG
jgi:hypothetical protein